MMSGAKKVGEQIQGNKTKHTIHAKVIGIRVACHCVSNTLQSTSALDPVIFLKRQAENEPIITTIYKN